MLPGRDTDVVYLLWKFLIIAHDESNRDVERCPCGTSQLTDLARFCSKKHPHQDQIDSQNERLAGCWRPKKKSDKLLACVYLVITEFEAALCHSFYLRNERP